MRKRLSAMPYTYVCFSTTLFMSFTTQDYTLKKRAEQKELLRKYVEHCAIMLQKTYKGYAVRKEYEIEISNQRRMRYLLTTAIRGTLDNLSPIDSSAFKDGRPENVGIIRTWGT